MRRTSGKSRPLSAISPTAVDDVGERTCRFLRRLHPARTAENVAADLRAWRVKTATISKMLERESTPGTALMLALLCVYGPDFLCAVLPTPPEWMDRARRADRQRACEDRIAALMAELDELK